MQVKNCRFCVVDLTHFVALTVAIGILMLPGRSFSAETAWLSSLDLSQMTSGWSVAKTNLGVVGTPLRIGGKEFARGIGTAAASKLRVDVAGKASRFFAQVCV